VLAQLLARDLKNLGQNLSAKKLGGHKFRQKIAGNKNAAKSENCNLRSTQKWKITDSVTT
jgi:hypothetical protein